MYIKSVFRRFPWYLSGEIVYPEVNVHRDVSFQKPFFDEKPEIVGKRRAFCLHPVERQEK